MTQRSILNWEWFSNVALIAFGSGFFQAAYETNDNFILHNIFVSEEDKLIGPLVYIIFGAWFGVLQFTVLALVFGKHLDKNYHGLKKPTRQTFVFALAVGLSSATYTFLNLLGLSLYDPGLVITLSTASIIGYFFADVLRGRVSFSKIVLPTLLIFGGALLTSVNIPKDTNRVEVAVGAIVLVLLVMNFVDVINEALSKEGATNTDSINFLIWRFIFLAIFGTIISISWALLTNKTSLVLTVFKEGVVRALPFIALTMACSFIRFVWQYKAFREEEMSIVNLLKNSRIFVGISVTYLINYFLPGAFGVLGTDIFSISIRVVGSIVVFAGIALITSDKLFQDFRKLRRNEVLTVKEGVI